MFNLLATDLTEINLDGHRMPLSLIIVFVGSRQKTRKLRISFRSIAFAAVRLRIKGWLVRPNGAIGISGYLGVFTLSTAAIAAPYYR